MTSTEKKIWKQHTEKIMNEGNDWDQMTSTDVVFRPLQKVTHLEMMNAVKKMKCEERLDPLK